MNDHATAPSWVTAKLMHERGQTVLGWTAAFAFFATMVLIEHASIDTASAPSVMPLATLLLATGATATRFIWLKRLAREYG